jgi:hypothetical protein
MCVIHHNESPVRVIFHFNKAHLQDPNIPMWVLKSKGQTHYVHHVEFSEGVGFRTKGSTQIKGRLMITKGENITEGKIY